MLFCFGSEFFGNVALSDYDEVSGSASMEVFEAFSGDYDLFADGASFWNFYRIF